MICAVRRLQQGQLDKADWESNGAEDTDEEKHKDLEQGSRVRYDPLWGKRHAKVKHMNYVERTGKGTWIENTM